MLVTKSNEAQRNNSEHECFRISHAEHEAARKERNENHCFFCSFDVKESAAQVASKEHETCTKDDVDCECHADWSARNNHIDVVHESWVHGKECCASIGNEVGHIGHDVMGVTLAYDIEIPMTIPTGKNVGESTKAVGRFHVI